MKCRPFVIRKVVPEVSVFLYKGIFCQIPLLLPQGQDIPQVVRIIPLYRLNIRGLTLCIKRTMRPLLQAVRDNGVQIHLHR